MKGYLKKTIICICAAAFVAVFANIPTDAATMHNVTYMYGTKSVTVQVAHGQNAPVPTDTAVPGYIFVSWLGSSANVTEDRVIVGVYASTAPAVTKTSSVKKVNNNTTAPWPEWWKDLNLPKGEPGVTCAVHWYNGWNGELWKTDIVPYGGSLADPADPCLSGFDFVGWEGDWTNVTEDRAIRAWYYETHKVKFIDDEASECIDIQYARNGESAWIDAPKHDGLEFDHYEEKDGNQFNGKDVHRDMEVYTVYTKK